MTPLPLITVNYSVTSRHILSVITPEGFQPETEIIKDRFPERVYPASEYDIALLLFDQQVFMVDLENETLHELLNGPAAKEVVGGGIIHPGHNRGERKVVLVTQQGISLYGESTGFSFSVPFERDLKHYDRVRFFHNEQLNRYYVWQRPSQSVTPMDSTTALLKNIEEYDDRGNQLNSYLIPSLSKSPIAPLLQNVWNFNLPLSSIPIGWVSLIKSSPNYADFQEFLKGWEWMLAGGLASMIAGLLIARYYALSRRVTGNWALFLFWFGIPGLITFWLVRDWPTLVRCIHCSKKRRVDLPTCEHCGQLWTAPATDGTELFESSTNEVTS